jgi:hypothetical protein
VRVSASENVKGNKSLRKRVDGIVVRVGESVIEGIGEEVSERQEKRLSEFEIIGECES